MIIIHAFKVNSTAKCDIYNNKKEKRQGMKQQSTLENNNYNNIITILTK